MDIPVILVIAAQDQIRASAQGALAQVTSGLGGAAMPSLPGVDLDMAFAPVPLGSGQTGDAIMAMTVDASSHFAVRGHIAAEDLGKIQRKIGGARVFSDPQIQSMPTCGGTPPVGAATVVATKLNVAALAAKNLDGRGVALAIVDTGINLPFVTAKIGRAPTLDAAASWRPPGATAPAPGAWPVNHGSMCAFDALIAAPKATLIDVPVLNARFPGGGSTMSGTLSAAIAAYAFLMASWAGGALHAYKSLVASNSWGIFHPSWDFPAGHPGRYCDNPLHPFNLQVGAAVRAGIDVIFAAGNCGAPCADGRCAGRTIGSIMGASAMSDVLTLAGCDINDDRVGYSSQGPSIPGMFQEKPDITSYTHFLGSEAFGAGTPDSGTSAACPVAAGCVAALRTSPLIPPTALTPANLFKILRDTARPRPGPAAGWNGDYGFGIIDPIAAATTLRI